MTTARLLSVITTFNKEFLCSSNVSSESPPHSPKPSKPSSAPASPTISFSRPKTPTGFDLSDQGVLTHEQLRQLSGVSVSQVEALTDSHTKLR